MSVLLKVVRINDIVVPIVAILCNVLLLFLIKIVKTKTLIHIKYSLIPNSILDILLSVTTFFVAPHLFHVEGVFYIIFGELFGPINNYHFACHLVALFSAITATNMLSITVSFYVRYLVICRNCTLSIRIMIWPYFILFFIFVTFYVLSLWFSMSATGGNFETQILNNLWKKEYGRSPSFVANKIHTPPFFTISGFLFATFSIAYATIFYISLRISQTLKNHVDNNATGIKLIHKQIQRTLFFQAIGPALIGSFPVLLLFTDSFFALSTTNSFLILSLFFPWASLCNPIAAFIFIKPYRNYIKTINVFKPFKRFSTTNISLNPPQNISFIRH